jgi:hypothetical protein
MSRTHSAPGHRATRLGAAALAVIASALVFAPPILAQTSAQSSQATPAAEVLAACPSGLLSVYYARGEATPSDETISLISRIGAEAAACQPDGIDLVTQIDNSGEADAVPLALARLGNVASELIASGVPADRIRLAARPGGASASPMGEVSVIFRKLMSGPDDAASPARPAQPQKQSDQI